MPELTPVLNARAISRKLEKAHNLIRDAREVLKEVEELLAQEPDEFTRRTEAEKIRDYIGALNVASRPIILAHHDWDGYARNRAK